MNVFQDNERTQQSQAPDEPGPQGLPPRYADETAEGAFRTVLDVCEYLGGSRTEPPAGFAFLASPWVRGFWWALLACGIIFFCGQTSKFIYIDF